MQEILTFVAYLAAWLSCTYLLKIEDGRIKLLISLIAAVLVYVLIGIKLSQKEDNKEDKD